MLNLCLISYSLKTIGNKLNSSEHSSVVISPKSAMEVRDSSNDMSDFINYKRNVYKSSLWNASLELANSEKFLNLKSTSAGDTKHEVAQTSYSDAR